MLLIQKLLARHTDKHTQTHIGPINVPGPHNLSVKYFYANLRTNGRSFGQNVARTYVWRPVRAMHGFLKEARQHLHALEIHTSQKTDVTFPLSRQLPSFRLLSGRAALSDTVWPPSAPQVFDDQIRPGAKSVPEPVISRLWPGTRPTEALAPHLGTNGVRTYRNPDPL